MGYLVYFADGMCTLSRETFSPLFCNAGYRKQKAIFPKSVLKSVISLLSRESLTLWSMIFADVSFKAGYHFAGKILKPAEKIVSGSAHPLQLKVK